MLKFLLAIICFSLMPFVYASKPLPAITKAIPVSQLTNFSSYPPNVQHIINDAYKLSTQNLTYQYGSADPKNGGMDCSGTIYYLLQKQKLVDVPRDSSGMYSWLVKNGVLHSGKDLSALKPGDLLFWSGTYATKQNPPITHVMLYLGENMQHQRLMFGSSDGRSYQGKKMWGVSVFDFKFPEKTTAKFVGYGCIPAFTCKGTTKNI